MRDLRARIASGVWLLLAGLTVSVSVVFASFTVKRQRAESVAAAVTLSEGFAGNIEKFVLWDDRRTVSQMLDAAVKRGAAEYGFIERDGKVYASSVGRRIPKGLLEPSGTGRAGSRSVSFLGKSSGVHYDASVSFLAGRGRLHLVLSRDRIDRAALASLAPVLLFKLLALAAGGFLSYLIARFSTREVARVTRAFQESEGRVRTLLEAVPLGIVELDSRGDVASANPGCRRIFGFREDELAGRPAADFLASRSRGAAHPEGLRRLMREDRPPRPVLLKGRTKRGEIIDLRVDWDYRRDPAGSATGLICALADITGRRRDEKERRDLNERFAQSRNLESLGVLAGGIAHDFNNLLGAIQGNAQLALEDLPAGSPLRARFSSISAVTAHASELCHQMLAYAGKARFSTRSIDLSRTVRETEVLLALAVPKRVHLSISLPDGLPPVRGDAAQIQRLVMNLVTNAAEAIDGDRGRVSVSTGTARCGDDFLRGTYFHRSLPAGTYATIEVADTGRGMSEEVKRKLFNPFFTTKLRGKGLGLAGVVGTIRSHGAALTVESSPGGGTAFKIYFPAASGRAEPAPEAPSAECWRGEGKVLVVDDEAPMRAVGREIFERLGFSVVDCADGREALSRFREDPGEFSLVLLDLTMPGPGGAEVLREIRRLRPGTPVVLTSGFDRENALRTIRAEGSWGFIPKPFNLGEFRGEVRRVLAAAGASNGSGGA